MLKYNIYEGIMPSTQRQARRLLFLAWRSLRGLRRETRLGALAAVVLTASALTHQRRRQLRQQATAGGMGNALAQAAQRLRLQVAPAADDEDDDEWGDWGGGWDNDDGGASAVTSRLRRPSYATAAAASPSPRVARHAALDTPAAVATPPTTTTTLVDASATGSGILLSLSFFVNRASLWTRTFTRRLATAIVESAMEVSRKSRTTAVAAASATQLLWQNTRAAVQTRAADAFARSVEARLDKLLDMVA